MTPEQQRALDEVLQKFVVTMEHCGDDPAPILHELLECYFVGWMRGHMNRRTRWLRTLREWLFDRGWLALYNLLRLDGWVSRLCDERSALEVLRLDDLARALGKDPLDDLNMDL